MVIMPPMTWTEARQCELNLLATQMSKLNHRSTTGILSRRRRRVA